MELATHITKTETRGFNAPLYPAGHSFGRDGAVYEVATGDRPTNEGDAYVTYEVAIGNLNDREHYERMDTRRGNRLIPSAADAPNTQAVVITRLTMRVGMYGVHRQTIVSAVSRPGSPLLTKTGLLRRHVRDEAIVNLTNDLLTRAEVKLAAVHNKYFQFPTGQSDNYFGSHEYLYDNSDDEGNQIPGRIARMDQSELMCVGYADDLKVAVRDNDRIGMMNISYEHEGGGSSTSIGNPSLDLFVAVSCEVGREDERRAIDAYADAIRDIADNVAVVGVDETQSDLSHLKYSTVARAARAHAPARHATNRNFDGMRVG